MDVTDEAFIKSAATFILAGVKLPVAKKDVGDAVDAAFMLYDELNKRLKQDEKS